MKYIVEIGCLAFIVSMSIYVIEQKKSKDTRAELNSIKDQNTALQDRLKKAEKAENDLEQALYLAHNKLGTCMEDTLKPQCQNQIVKRQSGSHHGIMGIRCDDPKHVVWAQGHETPDEMFGRCSVTWFCAEPAIGD